MGFFDAGQGSLEDVLGRQAETNVMNIENQYAKKRRQATAQQAKSGRLGSGVSNYSFGDVDAAEAGDIGDVYGGLAKSLGQIPIQDYSSIQDDARKRQLAELLAEINKPSALEEALGALGGFGNLAATGAAFF